MAHKFTTLGSVPSRPKKEPPPPPPPPPLPPQETAVAVARVEVAVVRVVVVMGQYYHALCEREYYVYIYRRSGIL
jgi:hypothetical protein